MLFKSLFTALALTFAQLAFAGKVVVFDHEEALLKTQTAQSRINALKGKPEYAQMLAQAENLRSDLEALSKERSSKGLTWSDAEKAENRKKIEYIQADFKLATQKLQAENSAVINAIMVELEPKLKKVLEAYVKAENVDLVLRRQMVYINTPAVDITAEIIKRLDKEK